MKKKEELVLREKGVLSLLGKDERHAELEK